MQRRDVLKSMLALGAAPAIGALPVPLGLAGAASAQTAAAPTRRFIDAHCHFFNAADIPIRGFLERVIFQDYPDTQVPASRSSLASIDLSVVRGMIATLADYLLKSGAPTPRQELQCLTTAASCADFSASPPAVAATRGAAISEAPRDADEIRVLGNVLQEALEQPRTRSLQPSPSGNADQADVETFMDAVLAEMRAAGRLPPDTTTRSLAPRAQTQAGVFDNVAAFLFGSSTFGRYFRWARLLTGYRTSIAQTYQTTYDPAGTRLALATPALVDYNYWLEDQSPAALREQVEVMSKISLRQRTPMHGFVAFDPLRELRHKAEEPSALAIAQEAVRDFGFLGVKLYSPMGFRPSGNDEGIGFPAFAFQLETDFGKKLDAALDSLYAWCEAEQVPILAHTMDSQGANAEFGARADPKFWLRVLERRPTLRLNLAHFGNFNLANSADNFKDTWEFQIGTMVKGGRFPNVYTDLSYFAWVLEGWAANPRRAQVKTMLSQYITQFDPNAERLLLGTDWTMMGRETGAEKYVDSLEAFLTEVGLSTAQIDNVFTKNALRFFGLTVPGKATERLARFYQANGRTMPTFG